MTPVEIINEIEECRGQLQLGITNLKTLAVKKAEAEKDYKIALRKQLLFLRSQGHGINLCLELGKGEDKVAMLKLESDIAESNYFVALEHIKTIRQELEVLKSMLGMEKLLSRD